VSAHRERGQVTVFVLGMAMVAVAVVGVAVDGTRAFLARRTLQNAADSAALAGAGELDEARLYGSGGRVVVLDPVSARRLAAEWLARRGLRVEAEIVADRSRVVVALRDEVATSFLGILGVGSIPVAAQADAEPRAGSTLAP
jgi:putative Flp pilus-assembly TadE/G-like protein